MLSVACFHQVSIFAIGIQLALFGVGIGLFHATNNAEIMSSAPESKSSLAGSLLALIRYLGQIAGIGHATALVGSMGVHPGAEASNSIPLRILFWICFLCNLGVAMMGWFRWQSKRVINENKYTNRGVKL